MKNNDEEPGDPLEFTASRAMWYSAILPEAGPAYLALHLVLQIVLKPAQWLKRSLSHEPR